MASDTAPAAIPGPNQPRPSTAPTTPATSGTERQPGGLAGLLAAVEPSRPAFTLNPENAAGAVQDEHAVTDASSARYNTEDGTGSSQQNSDKTSGQKMER